MLMTYNLLQLFLSPILAPVGLTFLAGREKYRHILPGRLGAGIQKPAGGRPRFWIHALSVGEVNAALPLIRGIRDRWPGCSIACSATTSTGLNALRDRASSLADTVFPSPFDILPVVRKFIRTLRPEYFILVETDLWPNWLRELRSSGAATILVNGSISSSAARRLGTLKSLARMLYGSLDLACMQSREDMNRLSGLGISVSGLRYLGNLKYDIKLPPVSKEERPMLKAAMGLDGSAPLWIAGSTHPGEEGVVLNAFKDLKQTFPMLQAIIAPRDPGRGREILSMASQAGFKARCRTQPPGTERIDILILDTLGELLGCYGLADVAFVGGSFVDTGGHNLLEPAGYGVPVLFGPFVESCMEMARELQNCGGGVQIKSSADLEKNVGSILRDRALADNMSSAARELVQENQGAVSRYIKVLSDLVDARG